MYNEGQPNCTPGGGMTDEAELLDIRQAAALLHVSAASLRRWSNAGLLASFRVGGRHERRFRRADLLALLESHPAAAGHATAATPPDTAAHGLPRAPCPRGYPRDRARHRLPGAGPPPRRRGCAGRE